MVEVGAGGTHQARYEREIIWDSISTRLSALDIGDASLVFGRLDWAEEMGGDQLYVGRVAVWDDDQEPVTIDWRAPAAEAFYRATGGEPMGLSRRRHFVTRGRELLGVEDEYFGESNGPAACPWWGKATLRAGLEAGRTGRLVPTPPPPSRSSKTPSSESPCRGVLVVQGGRLATGKTVAASIGRLSCSTPPLPLEGRECWCSAPTAFLTTLEQVLPSLGRPGVEVSMLAEPAARHPGERARQPPGLPHQGRPANELRIAPGPPRPAKTTALRYIGGLGPSTATSHRGPER